MSVDEDHVTAPHEWFLAGVPENLAIKIHASQSTLLASFAFMIAVFVGKEIDVLPDHEGRMNLSSLNLVENFLHGPVTAIVSNLNHATAAIVATGQPDKLFSDLGRKRNRDFVEVDMRLPEHLTRFGKHTQGCAGSVIAVAQRSHKNDLLHSVEIQNSGCRVRVTKTFGLPELLTSLLVETDKANFVAHGRNNEDIPYRNHTLSPTPLRRR